MTPNILCRSEVGCGCSCKRSSQFGKGQMLQVPAAPQKVVLFSPLQVINISTSTLLWGQKLREKAIRLPALLNSLKVLQCVLKHLCRKAAIVWPCPWPWGQRAGGPHQQPCSHPALLIPLQGCFLVLLGSADAQLCRPLQAQCPSPPQGLRLQSARASPFLATVGSFAAVL